MEDFETLHELVKTDPEAAWPRVVAFIQEHPEKAEGVDLLEDFVYEHDDRFVGRIEEAALADSRVREVVDQAHVGGFATIGAEEFHNIQERLKALRTYEK